MRCNGRRLLNYKQRMEKEEKGVPWVLQLVAASPPPPFPLTPLCPPASDLACLACMDELITSDTKKVFSG